MSDDQPARVRETAPSEPLGPSGRPGTWASLKIRNYRYLWLGQAGHAAGIWMEQAARPFLILDLTDGSASHVGGVLAVRTIPQFIFGMWAGVIADSFDRRMVLLIDKIAALLLNIAFVAVLASGGIELWHIYAYGALRGTIMAFDQPARMGLVPSTVPASHFTNAVALMSATQNAMRIFGAAAGGILYAAFGATVAFALIAAVYVMPVVVTYLLRVPPVPSSIVRSPSGMATGLMDGLRYCFSHAAIRGVLLLSAIYFMFGMSFIQVFSPLFADKVFEIGSAGFAGMTATMGVAALVASLFIATRQPDRLGAILPMITAGFGVALVLFSLTTYIPGPSGYIIPFALLRAPRRAADQLHGALTLDPAPRRPRADAWARDRRAHPRSRVHDRRRRERWLPLGRHRRAACADRLRDRLCPRRHRYLRDRGRVSPGPRWRLQSRRRRPASGRRAARGTGGRDRARRAPAPPLSAAATGHFHHSA